MLTRSLLIAPAGVLLLPALILVAKVSNTFEPGEDAPPSAGLRGVLPAEVPDELSADAFAELTGDLEELGISAAVLVADLYEGDRDTSESQRALIDQLRGKLEEMSRALSHSEHQAQRAVLRALHRRMQRRVEMAAATLDALEQSVSPDDARSAAATRIRNEISSLETYLSTISHGEAWLTYLNTGGIVTQLDVGNADDLLRAARTKLSGESAENDEQRSFLRREPFRLLGQAINVYLALNDPEQTDSLRRNLAALLQALEAYEANSLAEHARAVRSAYSLLKTQSPAAARSVGGALRSQHFNYNLHVNASESLISKFVAEKRSETGQIHDVILGAQVTGCQITNSTVGIDLQPGSDSARLVLTVTGHVRSSTRGVKHPATIYTSGSHYFRATKAVSFDGTRFTTSPVDVFVNANNFTTGATTSVSWIPLFGNIADSIVVSKAREKRPESEAIAAQRVASKVRPRFNEEADQLFSEANDDLDRQLYRPLRRTALYPSSISVRSSHQYLAVSSRTMGAANLGGSTPPAEPSPSGAAVRIHESLLNNWIDELDIGGRSLTEDELKNHVEQTLSSLLKREIRIGEEETGEYEEGPGKNEDDNDVFVFDATDPFRVQFENDTIVVIVRAGIRQEGEEEIPAQIIRVPIRFSIENDKIVFEADPARVTAVKRVGRTQQLPRAVQIRRILEARLPRREFDTRFDVELKDRDDVQLQVSGMTSSDGWLTIYAE